MGTNFGVLTAMLPLSPSLNIGPDFNGTGVYYIKPRFVCQELFSLSQNKSAETNSFQPKTADLPAAPTELAVGLG